MPTKPHTASDAGPIVPLERVANAILVIRDQRVLLDRDLAVMYGVPVSRLNEAVKRNLNRFPADFMFQLTAAEYESLISQNAISKPGRGGRRSPPYAFTEQRVAMLSSVLKSDRAVQVNVQIMRTFVRLRQMLASHADLGKKLSELEKKYDQHFAVVFDAIRQLMAEPPVKRKPAIGFHTEAGKRRK
jgi:hypothetical protein